MPITVQVTEGVLSPEAQDRVFAALTDLFLEAHQLSGNRFMLPNVIGEVAEAPRGHTYAGGKPKEIAIVELKVPSFALASPEQKAQFVQRATDILVEGSAGRLTRERVWVNMVYTVDGLWGIAGRAMSNGDLLQAVAA